MLEAYDTQLEMIVSGDEAKNNGDTDYYRYECACCGESVSIAAAESRSMVTHFRHSNKNNNDTACELYLGGQGQRFYEKGTNGGNIELYFDELKKTFQISISFSDAALREHESVGSSLSIASTRDYSDGSSAIEQPFYTEKITRNSFVPNEQKRIIISRFSRLYVLRNNISQASKYIEWFREQDKLAVFKVLNANGDYITAKLVKSKVLYTGVRYFVISYNHRSAAKQFFVPQSIESEKEFQFSTMDRNFFGRIITINDTGFEANRWCGEAGYDLAKSEQFGILWPPTAVIDGSQVSASQEVVAFSSFQLKARGNIKISPSDICDIGDCCYRLRLPSKVKVLYKNAEATIEHGKAENTIEALHISETFSDAVTTTPNLQYFSFSNDGVAELPSEMQYLLFGSRRVCGYRSSYRLEKHRPIPVLAISPQELIAEIAKVYRATEEIKLADFPLELTSIAESIIKESTETGLINAAIMRLIIGGAL